MFQYVAAFKRDIIEILNEEAKIGADDVQDACLSQRRKHTHEPCQFYYEFGNLLQSICWAQQFSRGLTLSNTHTTSGVPSSNCLLILDIVDGCSKRSFRSLIAILIGEPNDGEGKITSILWRHAVVLT